MTKVSTFWAETIMHQIFTLNKVREKGWRESHPAAVPSLHVTLAFLRKCSLISLLCCATRPPAAASCPASVEPAEPPDPLELPVASWTTGGVWLSTLWFPLGFFGDLEALAFRLFWHQIPPSRSIKTMWLSSLISEGTFMRNNELTCCLHIERRKELLRHQNFSKL